MQGLVAKVPGASRQLDPDTLLPENDKRGRPLWTMPRPYAHTTHIHPAKKEFGEERGTVVTVSVPVYRGVDAQTARYIRSQIKRRIRKQKEKREKSNV